MIHKPLRSDAEAIAEIEAFSPSPWSAAAILSECDRHNGVQFVAVDGKSGPVVGWCCAMVAADEAELLRIAVHVNWRRYGIATALLRKLEGECAQQKVKRIFLEVRAKNKSAQTFYQKYGFSCQYIRKKYYRKPDDDAVIYGKQLS